MAWKLIIATGALLFLVSASALWFGQTDEAGHSVALEFEVANGQPLVAQRDETAIVSIVNRSPKEISVHQFDFC